MQETVATAAQTQQWAFILSQLFDWVMAGLAWIVPFQARVFQTILQGDSFWSLAGASVLLVLPAAAFVAVAGGTFGRRPRQSITDANGAFAFDRVEPAQYILSVEKTGFASYPDMDCARVCSSSACRSCGAR